MAAIAGGGLNRRVVVTVPLEARIADASEMQVMVEDMEGASVRVDVRLQEGGPWTPVEVLGGEFRVEA